MVEANPHANIDPPRRNDPGRGSAASRATRDSSPAPTGGQSSGSGVTGDQDMDDTWDEDGGEEPTWEDVLLIRGRETRRDVGGSAVADPLPVPRLGHQRNCQNHVPYTAVPQAAAPRRNRGDRHLHSLQRKMEVALSLMTESQEDASATPTVLQPPC